MGFLRIRRKGVINRPPHLERDFFANSRTFAPCAGSSAGGIMGLQARTQLLVPLSSASHLRLPARLLPHSTSVHTIPLQSLKCLFLEPRPGWLYPLLRVPVEDHPRGRLLTCFSLAHLCPPKGDPSNQTALWLWRRLLGRCLVIHCLFRGPLSFPSGLRVQWQQRP